MSTVTPTPTPSPLVDFLSQLWTTVSGYKTYAASVVLLLLGLNLIYQGNVGTGSSDVLTALGQLAVVFAPLLASLRHAIQKATPANAPGK